jgi:magnesium-transporting ATPase (P-type)
MSEPTDHADEQDTIRDFETHATEGLSSSALSALVARYGMNEFELPPSEPLWLKMAKQVYEQPLILMLLASSVVSALFGSYDDAVCVLVAVGIVLTGMSALMEVERSLIGSCVCTRTTVGEISRSAQQGMIPH